MKNKFKYLKLNKKSQLRTVVSVFLMLVMFSLLFVLAENSNETLSEVPSGIETGDDVLEFVEGLTEETTTPNDNYLSTPPQEETPLDVSLEDEFSSTSEVVKDEITGGLVINSTEGDGLVKKEVIEDVLDESIFNESLENNFIGNETEELNQTNEETLSNETNNQESDLGLEPVEQPVEKEIVEPIEGVIEPVIEEPEEELIEDSETIEPIEPIQELLSTLLSIVTKITAYIGQVIDIETTLTYENYTPIIGQSIDFYTIDNFSDEYLGTQITNNKGKAEFNWNTSGFGVGTYWIVANFTGSDGLEGHVKTIDIVLEEDLVKELVELNETEEFVEEVVNDSSDELGNSSLGVVNESLGELNSTSSLLELDNLSLKDSKGRKVKANYKILKKNKEKGVPGEMGVSVIKEKFDLEVIPENLTVKKIVLNNVDLSTINTLGLEDLPNDFEMLHGRWAQVYAIDPTGLDFTQGEVTVVAKGSSLYKCKDYNFNGQDCFGDWVLFKDGLTPGEEYTFILTGDDPVFAEQVSTCSAENSAASKGSFASACDQTDGSLLESDNSLVETQTYGKNEYGGLRIQSVDTSVTNCATITTVVLCYERWVTANPDDCDVSVDASGGGSYTAVTTTCPGTAANPGVTCSDVTSIGETFVCGSFFGSSGTRALAKMENDRTNPGGATTETLSTDVFYFNVTYTVADNVFPQVNIVNPSPANNTYQNTNSVIVNSTLVDDDAAETCTLEWDGTNESMSETTISATSKRCDVTKSSLADASYTFRVFGNDTGNNMNVTGTRTVTIDTTNPEISIVSPSYSSGTYTPTNYLAINITATDTNLQNITIELYNLTGGVASIDSNTTTTSPHFINYTSLVDGIYYFNASTYDNATNANFTVERNVTIDTTFPLVTDPNPQLNSAFDASTIEIAINVTEVNNATIFANVTFPNSTLEVITLSFDSNNKYNGSFTAPAFPGSYNVTFAANDSAGNLNDTTVTNFTINDIYPPNVTYFNPSEGSNFGKKDNVSINVSVGDQTSVDTVIANITLPNTTVVQETLVEDGSSGYYNVTFNQTNASGTYTILILATDTSGNVNDTEERTFSIQDNDPIVTIVGPGNNTINGTNTIDFICSVTDDTGLSNMTLYHNITQAFGENETNEISGLSNETTFTLSSIPDGTYIWNCLANDTNNNTNFAVQNFTINIDTTNPNATSPQPTERTNYSTGQTVSLNVTVLDNFTISQVIANVTLPDGTIEEVTLSDTNSDDIFNSTFSTTSLLGRYNVTFIANDSVNNRNESITTFFNVTSAPNVSLVFPANTATLNTSLIRFNFSTTDDHDTISTCTLYTNHTGSWLANESVTDISNNTQNNITLALPDGTYLWNFECTDNMGFSNFSESNYTVTTSTTLTGLFAYQELNIQTPRYRLWNEDNVSTNEITDTQSVSGDITWVVTKANHERQEFIVGTEDKTNDVNVQVYDSSAKTWGNLQEVSTDVPNSGFRAFDIAYEDISGDALIVYETSASADSVFGYRKWNGTGYTTAQTFTTDLASATINWVSLVQERGSNNIMALIHNSAGDLYAIPWNGGSFDGAKNITLSTATVSSTEEHFAFAWEENSSEGLVVYGESTNLVYRTYNGSDWSSETTESLGDSLDATSLCSDLESNHIGLIYQTDLTAVNASMWNGSEFLSNSPTGDSTTEANGANNINVDCTWYNSTTALFGFVDVDALTMDYFTFSTTNTWSDSDLTTTSTTGDFATDDIASLSFVKQPLKSTVIITAMDIANDVSAHRWDGTSFQKIIESPFEQDTEVSVGDQEGVSFDWVRFDEPPAVVNITPNGTFTNNQVLNISANVTDVSSLSSLGEVASVIANITAPNGTIKELTLLDGDSDGIYNNSFSAIGSAGTYNITIIALDNSTHLNYNNTESETFTVNDIILPSVFNLTPALNSVFNVSNVIEIFANATDDTSIDTVIANITHPNGTTNQLTLNNGTDHAEKFNASFTIPSAIGLYNLSFYANDTSGNENKSEVSNFTINDANSLTVKIVSCLPDPANISDSIECNATVTDDIGIDTVNVTVYYPNGTENNPTVENTGDNYNFTFTATDIIGQFNVTWQANDTSNNIQTNTTNFTINDITSPNVTLVDTTTNSTNQSVTWIFVNITASDANLETLNITLYNASDDVKLNSSDSTSSPAEINFTGAVDGTYYFNATANDTSGNENFTQTRTVVVDTTAPTIIFVDPTTNETNQSVTWVFANVSVTDSNFNTVNVTLYNSSLGKINSSSGTSTPHNVNFTGLADGTYYLNASANDSAGNINITANRTIIVDNVNPTVTLVGPTDNSSTITTNTYIAINVTGTDASTSILNLTIDLFNGSEVVNVSNSSTTSPHFVNFTGLSDGVWYFNASGYDSAGNLNFSATRNVTIDTVNPTINFVDVSTNDTNQSATWIFGNVTANDTNLDTINITLFNSTGFVNSSDGTSSPQNINFTGLPDGTYTLNASANDSAGNTGVTATRTIIIDNVDPTVILVDPTDNSSTFTTNTYIAINATATDASSGILNLTIDLFNSSGAVNVSNSSTSSPHFINFTGLSEGIWYFNATGYDSVGNLNFSVTRNVTIDTTNPTITLVDVSTNTTNVSQSWIFANVTASDTNLESINITLWNASNDVKINSSQGGSSPHENNFTGAVDGTYYLNASSNDSAGNEVFTATRTIVLDTTNPVVTLVDTTTNSTNQSATWIFVNTTASDATLSNLNITLFNVSDGNKINSTDAGSSPLSINFTVLADGSYYFNATANDSADNSGASSTRTIVIDNTNPTVTFVDPTTNTTNQSVTAIFANITASDTNLDTLNITLWNASNDAKINSTDSTTSPLNINFTLLVDGPYYLNATSNDSVANIGETATRTITIDTTGPVITLVDTTTNSTNQSATWIFINTTASDATLSIINITLFNASDNGKLNSTSSGSSPLNINYTLLVDGTYYFNATANDSADNSNVTETRTVVIDTTNPTATFVDPTTNNTNQSVTAIFANITASDTNLDSLNITLWNASNDVKINSTDSTTSPLNINFTLLVDGPYYLNATSNDSVANIGETATRTITVDTQNPTVTQVAPANDTLEQTTNTITHIYNVTDLTSDINNCSLYINDTLDQTDETVSKNVNQSFSKTLANGVYNWSVGCIDYANNSFTTGNFNLSINVTAPTVTLDSPVDHYNSSSTANEFNCSAIDNSALVNMTLFVWNLSGSLEFNNTTDVTGISNNTNWTVDLAADANYTWNCEAYDDSALLTRVSTNNTINIDTTTPTIEYVTFTETSATFVNRNYVQVNVSSTDLTTGVFNTTIFLYDSSKVLQSTDNLESFANEANFTGLSDGIYYFNATSYDFAGNTNETTERNVTVDTTNPTVTFVDPTTNTTNVSQSWIFANITASDTNLDTLNITLWNVSNGVKVNTTDSTSSPHSINFTGLVDGAYYLNSTSNDSASNIGETALRTITLDTTSPVVTLVDTTTNTTNQSATWIFVNATIDDATLSLINITLFNASNDAKLNSSDSTSSPFNFNFTLLVDGTYYFNATANDSGDNSGFSETRTVVIDNTNPTVTFVDPTTNTTNVSQSFIFANVTGSDANLNSLNITLWNASNDVKVNSTDSTSSPLNINFTGLVDGAYYLNSTVNDSVANIGESATRTIVLDTQNPTVTLVNPTTNITNQSATWIFVNSTVSDATLDSINITLFNASNNVKLNSSTGVSSPLTFNFTLLVDGIYYFNTTANDSANNSGSSNTRTVVVDATDPVISFVNETTNTSNLSQSWIFVNVTASDTNLDTINITLFNASNNAKLNSSDGTISPQNVNFTGIVDGSYFINATANDSARNSNFTATRNIELDRTLPIITSVNSTPNVPIYNNGTVENVSVTFTSSEYPVNLSFLLYNSSGDLVNETANVTLNSASDLPQNYTIPGDLGDGNYSLNFSIYDASSNLNLTNLGSIVIDATSADISSVNITPNTPVYNNGSVENVSVTFTSSEYPVNISFLLYDSSGSLVNETANVTLNAANDLPLNYTIPDDLSDGNYSLNFTIYDLAGNLNLTSLGSIVIDATSPDISSVSSTPTAPVYNNGSVENVSVTFTSSEYPINISFLLYDSSGSLVNETANVSLSGSTELPQNYTIPGDLSDGNYSLNFTIYDLAGNLNLTNIGTVVIDASPPSVDDPNPIDGSQFSLLTEIEVAVNVTDASNISSVVANVTLPNGTVETVALALTSGDTYNSTFFNTTLLGKYNITFVVNDSLSNLNDSQNTSFTIVDDVSPTITVLGCTPANISTSQLSQCIATVTDNFLVDTISANVTLPNGTTYTQSVTNISSNYFFNYTTGSFAVGEVSVGWFANDSSGNINSSTADSFNVSDRENPSLTLNVPIVEFNQSSSTVDFNFTATDDLQALMSCELVINGTIDSSNTSVENGSRTIISVGSLTNGTYLWNVTCNDSSGNFNASETRNVTVDSEIPTFISLATTPSTTAGLDPKIDIELIANITDNFTAIHTVIFQYMLSNESTFTNITGELNGTGGFNQTFNATQNGTYSLRLWANDTAGNSEFSNIINITVEYDNTWTRTPSVFTAIATTLNNNVSIGNLTINNTGDFPLNFTIVSDSNLTTYNESENFSLSPNGFKVIAVNDSASSSGLKTVTLNITSNDTTITANLLQTSGNLVVAPGQPILSTTITNPTTDTLSVTQGDTNIAFAASLQNIGEGNASNLTFFFDIPTDWTLTFGQINTTASSFNTGDTKQLSIEVTVPEGAITGTFNVTANATAVNSSSTDLHTLDLIFAKQVEITVNALPEQLGAVVVTQEASVDNPSAAASSAAGSGGGGGGVARKIINTNEVIEVVRGDIIKFPITIQNIHNGFDYENVKLDLSGFLAEYLSWTPKSISKIKESKSGGFAVVLEIPSYFTESEYTLTAKITADLVPNDGKGARQKLVESREITLRIKDISKDDLTKDVLVAEQCIADMKEKKFNTIEVDELFTQAKIEVESYKTKQARSLLTKICQIRNTAFEASGLLVDIDKKIAELEQGALAGKAFALNFNTPETLENIELARLAFARGDYALALERLKDAQLQYVLETRGTIDFVQFIEKYWWYIVLVSIVSLFFLLYLSKHLYIVILRKRIHYLNHEELTIHGLIGEAQKDYIHKKLISESQYNKITEQYHKRIAELRKSRANVRSKIISVYNPAEEKELLGNEREELHKSLKRLQHDYFIKHKGSKNWHDFKHESIRERLREVENEEGLLKKRKSKMKKSTFLWKLVSFKFLRKKGSSKSNLERVVGKEKVSSQGDLEGTAAKEKVSSKLKTHMQKKKTLKLKDRISKKFSKKRKVEKRHKKIKIIKMSEYRKNNVKKGKVNKTRK